MGNTQNCKWTEKNTKSLENGELHSIDAMVRRNEIMPRCNSLLQIFQNNDYSQNLAKKDAVKTFKRSRHITFCYMNMLSLF